MEWNGESGIGVRLSGRIQQHVRCAEGGGRWARSDDEYEHSKGTFQHGLKYQKM